MDIKRPPDIPGEDTDDDTAAAAHLVTAARRRVSPLAVLRLLLYLSVLGFLGYEMWQARHGLGASLRTVGWGNAAVALLFASIGVLPTFVGWRLLLAALDIRLAPSTGARVYFPSMVTRYLPGGVWPVAVQATRARSLGVPPVRFVGGFLATQGLAVIAGLLVGLLALGQLVAASPLWWALLPASVLLLIPVAVRRVRDPALRLGSRIVRRLPSALELPGSGPLLAATGVMAVGWVITGLHLVVLAVALGAPIATAVPVCVGGFALSVVAGALAVVLPSGLGVRELVLGLALSPMLSGPALVAVVALSRVLTTAGDVLCTAVMVGLARPRRRVRPEAAS